MRNKYFTFFFLITISIFNCDYLFAKQTSRIVIYDMPQDLRDFFETADACEAWIIHFNSHLGKTTYNIVESVIKENCSDIEHKLSTMKNKYKNNKDYSARLTVYDDTIIIYDEYKKTRMKNKSN